MMIRKAKGTDANELKTLYFEYLTHFPPKEEQDMSLWQSLLEKASEIARERRCYKVFLETGSNKESTLNFYRNNGFAIDEKHSCLKRL